MQSELKQGPVEYKRYAYTDVWVDAYYVGINSKGNPVIEDGNNEYFTTQWSRVRSVQALNVESKDK